tara:strand:+ start:22056 stop:22463 length:408 start_codon:yes stop_codon:yes gene_type:complete
MASVRANLTLASPGVMSSPLNLNVSSAFTADSGSLIRGKVLGVAAGSDATVIYKPSDKLDRAYIYISNLDQEREHFIFVYADTSSDDPVVMKIAGGEFAFFPAKNDISLKAYGTEVDQIIEYGVFGLDSSAVRLS